jgi:hypothetical protein
MIRLGGNVRLPDSGDNAQQLKPNGLTRFFADHSVREVGNSVNQSRFGAKILQEVQKLRLMADRKSVV